MEDVMERDWGAEAARLTQVRELAGRVRELTASNELLTQKCIDQQKVIDAFMQRKGHQIQ
jgi:hypothetical protein